MCVCLYVPVCVCSPLAISADALFISNAKTLLLSTLVAVQRKFDFCS